MIGIDHKRAPVEIREKFAFTSREGAEFLLKIKKTAALDGCVLLTTCSRTELWVSPGESGAAELLPLLCEFKGLCESDYVEFFYDRSGYEAVEYLFETASGLKSMILGEDQILAQVKKAYESAMDINVCGSVLSALFRSAVTGAKRVKTELKLSTANASAADCALESLKESGTDFENKRCLVIGNGEMGKRAASKLLSFGADVTVTIREYKSGIVSVVPGCKRINYSERYAHIPLCDVVVSATSSPNITLSYKEIINCGLKGDTVFIDLAVPRDIEREIGTIDGVSLYNIDSFSAPETDELKHELSAAKKLLDEQRDKFINWYECRDLLPAMEKIGEYVAGEIEGRVRGKAGSAPLNGDDTNELCSRLGDASKRVIKKLLFAVRDEAGIDVFRKCVAAMEGVENGV